MTIKINGSGPITLSFTDGSSHSYTLSDEIVLAALARDYSAHQVKATENTVDFCEITYPDDLSASRDGRTLSAQECMASFEGFLVMALREATLRILPENQS